MTDTAFIDLLGLSRDPQRAAAVAESLELDGTFVSGEGQRIATLRRLRRSAGVTLYTGPAGAAYWLPVSVEVKVRLVPDGTDLRDRHEADMEWALQAVGATDTEAKQLTKTPPKTARHSQWETWREAESLLAEVLAPGNPEPIVHTTFEAEAVYEDEALRLLDNLRDANPALDWEWDTETLEPHGLGLATEDRNWYIPVQASDYRATEGYGDRLRDATRIHLRSGPSCWHNGKADLQTQYPGDPAELAGLPIDDTLIMAYIVGDTGLGLKELARQRLGRDPLDWPGSLADQPLEVALRYAGAGDARNTWDLRKALKGPLLVQDPMNVYEKIERPVMPIVASMEKYGLPVDIDELQRLTEAFTATEEGLRSYWWQRTHLDISNDEELRRVVELYTGYDPGTVRADVLARYEGDWMDSLLAYRRIRHRRRSFLSRHLQRWDRDGRPLDFRGYSDFNQAGAPDEQDERSFRRAPRSGRFSSSSKRKLTHDGKKVDIGFGNLQNQPGGDASIRSIFVPPPCPRHHRETDYTCETCYLWWSYDYSSIEVVIAACMSQDPEMLKRLGNGTDMHQALVDDVYRRSGITIPRVAAKRGNFNAYFGGREDSLGKQLQKERVFLPRETLTEMVETHRETYKRYYEYGNEVIAIAKANGGYSETLFGRRRYDSDLFSADATASGHAERALINMTIQGTAADIIKRALSLINKTVLGLGAHTAVTVHDESGGWVPAPYAAALMQQVPPLMESIPLPGLPLKVSGGVGRNWEEVHG